MHPAEPRDHGCSTRVQAESACVCKERPPRDLWTHAALDCLVLKGEVVASLQAGCVLRGGTTRWLWLHAWRLTTPRPNRSTRPRSARRFKSAVSKPRDQQADCKDSSGSFARETFGSSRPPNGNLHLSPYPRPRPHVSVGAAGPSRRTLQSRPDSWLVSHAP